MYKHSTQKNHRHIAREAPGAAVWRHGRSRTSRDRRSRRTSRISTQAGYAPKTIDHIHDVLSAVLRTAVKWGHLQDNPARGVDLPTLKTVRPKWALTTGQAAAVARGTAAARPDDGRAWRCCRGFGAASCSRCGGETSTSETRTPDGARGGLRGRFDTPKTAAGVRQIPLSEAALQLVADWRASRRSAPNRTRWSSRRGRANPFRRTTCCGGRSFRPATRWDCRTGDLADVPTHLLVVGAREGRAGQGRGAADGPRQGRHDAQRLHAGDRRRAARRPSTQSEPNCSLLFTNRRERRS